MNVPNTIDEEYKYIEKSSDSKLKNLKHTSDKIIAFQTSMAILKDVIIAIPGLSDSPFDFLDELFSNFTISLEKNVVLMKDTVLNPLNNIMNNFKNVVNDKLKKINKLKSSIIEENKNLLVKKEKYLNYANNNKIIKERINKTKNNLEDLDDKIFDDAMKENYVQLYNYEVNKMNEIIEEKESECNVITTDFKALIASSVMMLKESLTKFSNIIKKFGEIFNTLSSEVKNKIDNYEKLNSMEILKEIAENSSASKTRVKKDIKERSHIRNIKTEINLDLNKTKDDINNADNQLNLENEKERKENENYILDIINNLFKNEEEVKSTNISKLFNILETDDIVESANYSKIILEKIKKDSKDVVFIKNYNNFIHIANIINDIHLNNKTNINIFYLIVGVSQMIRYHNNFLYNVIRKKNEYFRTKLLWIKLIDESLINKISKYINNINFKKEEDKDKDKDKDKEIDKKENLKQYLKKKELEKILKDYKRLNKTQRQELSFLISKIIIHNIGKLVPSMYCFLQNKAIIEEIINEYKKDFNINENQISYLDNILQTKIKINDKNINNDKKDLTLTNKIIITSVLKYLQMNEYPKILKINKKINSLLKDNIYLHAFSYSKLPINLNLKFWHIYLKIDKLKKSYNYKDIKLSVNMSIDQKKKQKKSIGVVEQDLKRTLYITHDQKNYDAIKSILNCFLLTFPKIGYCQGMNFIVAFLFQLLNKDEELSFYYLCGLELNTKHRLIFEDEFITLNIIFNAFNTFLNIIIPELYYKFLNENIEPNCYGSSWFITLFTEYIKVIDKDKPPSLLIFLFNRFIFEGWSAIFNFGLMIMQFSYDKIIKYEKDKLITFMINIVTEEKIFDEKNFEACKSIYLKNTKYIEENFVDVLIDIKKFEYNNK